MIDTDSPAGSYRAALNPAASCAVCRQSVCDHPDLLYAGLVPAPEPAPTPGAALAGVSPPDAPANSLDHARGDGAEALGFVPPVHSSEIRRG